MSYFHIIFSYRFKKLGLYNTMYLGGGYQIKGLDLNTKKAGSNDSGSILLHPLLNICPQESSTGDRLRKKGKFNTCTAKRIEEKLQPLH